MLEQIDEKLQIPMKAESNQNKRKRHRNAPTGTLQATTSALSGDETKRRRKELEHIFQRKTFE